MRPEGYEVVQIRGRVSGASYKTGAVWGRAPGKPRLVSGKPAEQGQGNLQLRVAREGSDVVADWELSTTAVSPNSGRPRRVHTVKSVRRPVIRAALEALAYAERHGYTSVWVVDPTGSFPKTAWPAT